MGEARQQGVRKFCGRRGYMIIDKKKLWRSIILPSTHNMVSWDSVSDIAIRYGLDGPRIETR